MNDTNEMTSYICNRCRKVLRFKSSGTLFEDWQKAMDLQWKVIHENRYTTTTLCSDCRITYDKMMSDFLTDPTAKRNPDILDRVAVEIVDSINLYNEHGEIMFTKVFGKDEFLTLAALKANIRTIFNENNTRRYAKFLGTRVLDKDKIGEVEILSHKATMDPLKESQGIVFSNRSETHEEYKDYSYELKKTKSIYCTDKEVDYRTDIYKVCHKLIDFSDIEIEKEKRAKMRVTSDIVVTIMECRSKGMTREQISEYCKISKGSVDRVIKAYMEKKGL